LIVTVWLVVAARAPPVVFDEPAVAGICVPADSPEPVDGTTLTFHAWIVSAWNWKVDVSKVAILLTFVGDAATEIVMTGTVVSSVIVSTPRRTGCRRHRGCGR
jgi:hypothetical protein